MTFFATFIFSPDHWRSAADARSTSRTPLSDDSSDTDRATRSTGSASALQGALSLLFESLQLVRSLQPCKEPSACYEPSARKEPSAKRFGATRRSSIWVMPSPRSSNRERRASRARRPAPLRGAFPCLPSPRRRSPRSSRRDPSSPARSRRPRNGSGASA